MKAVHYGILFAMLTVLAGCGQTRVVTETKTVNVPVPVRVACPDKATYSGLKAARPVPLRQQTAPKTAVERVARSEAQLGRYEAPGEWADKVEAALDRCQIGDEKEGVADVP